MENHKILVVEDDQVLSKVINEELNEAGFDVRLETNGRAGLEAAQSDTPELILLDLLMPEMHGFEVLEELKRSPATQGIPVIILTMLGSDEDIKKGLKLGANDYVVKSQHPVGEIVEKVQNFFGQESHPEAGAGETPSASGQSAAPQQPAAQQPAEAAPAPAPAPQQPAQQSQQPQQPAQPQQPPREEGGSHDDVLPPKK